MYCGRSGEGIISQKASPPEKPVPTQQDRAEKNVLIQDNDSQTPSFLLRQMAGRAALVSFGSILLAEMGDKTQLATLLLSARSQNAGVIFLGAAAALISTSLIGVWAGAWVARLIPPRWIKTLAGVGFVVMGLVLLWGSLPIAG
ncbi:Ca2+/H+ antiporter, TMEM165/GDT1 family [Thermostichus sp. MS-CIW-37]